MKEKIMSEKEFEDKVKKYLKSKNAWFLKTWGGGMQRSGIPDILACVNGKFFGIELKSDKGVPSELQLWNIANIIKAGGVAGVYAPKDFDLLKREVELACES